MPPPDQRPHPTPGADADGSGPPSAADDSAAGDPAATDLARGDAGSTGDAAAAAAEALARARAAARAKGLRPGLRPRRRPRDVPDDRSGPASGRSGRDPLLIGDQIDRFVVERGWRADVAVGAVIGRWPQIVGPEIAAHCTPTDFVDGVLTVRADSTAWATQLRLLESTLMGRLADEVGEGTVGELRVVGPGAPTWSRGWHRVQDGRGPRDTYG
jgi:predicted nucleic acid-binding Zn ribbon protein